jgi:poly(3-hydroxybutyrate) depolymerase
MLCSGIPAALKEDYVQPVVGHYGVFNGRRFRDEIYPRVRAHIRRSEAAIDAAAREPALPKEAEAA